jgi:hypothetical protein
LPASAPSTPARNESRNRRLRAHQRVHLSAEPLVPAGHALLRLLRQTADRARLRARRPTIRMTPACKNTRLSPTRRPRAACQAATPTRCSYSTRAPGSPSTARSRIRLERHGCAGSGTRGPTRSRAKILRARRNSSLEMLLWRKISWSATRHAGNVCRFLGAGERRRWRGRLLLKGRTSTRKYTVDATAAQSVVPARAHRVSAPRALHRDHDFSGLLSSGG